MQHQVIVSFGKDKEFDFKLGGVESGGLADLGQLRRSVHGRTDRR